jgi:hypothetical protein
VSLKVLLGKGGNVKYRPHEHTLGVSLDRRRRFDSVWEDKRIRKQTKKST